MKIFHFSVFLYFVKAKSWFTILIDLFSNSKIYKKHSSFLINEKETKFENDY